MPRSVIVPVTFPEPRWRGEVPAGWVVRLALRAAGSWPAVRKTPSWPASTSCSAIPRALYTFTIAGPPSADYMVSMAVVDACHLGRGVREQDLLLVRRHDAEQYARLAVVVVIDIHGSSSCRQRHRKVARRFLDPGSPALIPDCWASQVLVAAMALPSTRIWLSRCDCAPDSAACSSGSAHGSRRGDSALGVSPYENRRP